MESAFPRDPYPESSLEDIEPLSGEAFAAWDYRPDAGWAPEFDLVGYRIEATDGPIGTVRDETHVLGASHLVVDIGPWIFGRRALLPAGTVRHIDHICRKIHIDRTRQHVRSSPQYRPDKASDPSYWYQVASHYGGG